MQVKRSSSQLVIFTIEAINLNSAVGRVLF